MDDLLVADSCTAASSFRAKRISATAVSGPWEAAYPRLVVSRTPRTQAGPPRRADAGFAPTFAAVALAASLLVLAHGGIAHSGVQQGELNAVSVALTVCSTVPIIFWQRSPMGVFLTTAAASSVLSGLGYRVDLPIGPAVALYLLAASRDADHPWQRKDTAAAVGALGVFVAASGAGIGGFPSNELLHGGLVWTAAWFAGERTRLRREQIAELQQRAWRAERDADRDRRLAIAEERARIARDLHDSAGHAINVIAVRASAGRLGYEQQPERARLALEAIEDLARQTAGEIDEIVHSLRHTDGANAAPLIPTGLASLETLVTHHTSAGLAVTLHVAPGSPRPLTQGADQAAYRIVQEALTNAARHGTGQAHVEVVFADDALELTVTNPVGAANLSRAVGGHGLIGMRERATLLGGTLEAGRVNGTFRVCARLPYAQQGMPV